MKKISLIIFLIPIFIVISCKKEEETGSNDQKESIKIENEQSEVAQYNMDDSIYRNIYKIKEYFKKIENATIEAEQKKIAFMNSEPSYAPKNQFESDLDYYKRISKNWNKLISIEREATELLWSEVRKLRDQVYVVDDFSVELGNYDANKEEYTLILGPYSKYNIGQAKLIVKISKPAAKSLFDNWKNKSVETTLILDDLENVKPLKFKISEPTTGFKYEKEYPVLRQYDSPLGTEWISPDNKFAIRKKYRNLVIIESLENGATIFQRNPDLKVLEINISKNWRYLGIGTKHKGGYAYGNSIVYDLQTLEPVISQAFTAEVRSIAFSPNEKYVAVGVERDRSHTRSVAGIYVFNLYDGKIFRQVEYDYGTISSSFSDDGKYLALLDTYTFYFYNFKENKLLKEYKILELYGGSRDSEYSIISNFSPDAKYLYTSRAVYWTYLE